MRRRNRRQAGFTLMELVTVSAVASTLILAFTVSHLELTEKASVTDESARRVLEANLVMNDLENVLRMADEVIQADDDLLVVDTRHYVNSDDTVERLRFTLSGGTLYKEVKIGAGAYGAPEPIMDDVDAFRTFRATIVDDFPRTEYDVALTEGGSRSIDTAVKTDYNLKELGDIDSDFVDHYDADAERVHVKAGDKVHVTLTPPLPKRGLRASVQFTPMRSGRWYRPLMYGDLFGHKVGVSFYEDGYIKLIRRDASNILVDDISSGIEWSNRKTYRVGLVIDHDTCIGWIDDGTTKQKFGPITTIPFDDKPLHFQVRDSDGGEAAWDDLEVDYPIVNLELGFDVDGNTETLYGGAGSRQ